MINFIKKIFKNSSDIKSKKNRDESFDDIKIKKQKNSPNKLEKGLCGFDCCGLDCGCCDSMC